MTLKINTFTVKALMVTDDDISTKIWIVFVGYYQGCLSGSSQWPDSPFLKKVRHKKILQELGGDDFEWFYLLRK